jgi:hypothetical protein
MGYGVGRAGTPVREKSGRSVLMGGTLIGGGGAVPSGRLRLANLGPSAPAPHRFAPYTVPTSEAIPPSKSSFTHYYVIMSFPPLFHRLLITAQFIKPCKPYKRFSMPFSPR